MPVAIEGARKALPPDGFAVRPELIRVCIGAPIATTAVDRNTLIERARAEVVALGAAAEGPHPSR